MIEKIKTKLVLDIENSINSIITENGFNIVDLDIKGGNNKQITLLLYSDKSFGIEELGKLSKTIYPILEKKPFLKNGFSLELSSPGIYRNIKYFKEFNIYKGRIIKVTTNTLEIITGISYGYENDYLSLKIDGNMIKILLADIKSAKLNG